MRLTVDQLTTLETVLRHDKAMSPHNWMDVERIIAALREGMEQPLGMRVEVRFTDGRREVYRNVTEIHSHYPPEGERIAFESDVHGTGSTWDLRRIEEYEAKVETEVAPAF